MSNDRCIRDQKTKTVDLEQQDEADDIIDTPPADNSNGNPLTAEDTRKHDATHFDTYEEGLTQNLPCADRRRRKTVERQNQELLARKPDSEAIDSASGLVRSPILRFLNHTRHENGNMTYQFQHANTTYTKYVPADQVSHKLAESMKSRQAH